LKERKKGGAGLFFSNNLPAGNIFAEDAYFTPEAANYQIK
jgi:hypothetical protein